MKRRFHHLLVAAPVVLAWIWTWHYLASEWSTNSQYEFGFVVPLLGLYLAWRNWPKQGDPVAASIDFAHIRQGVYDTGSDATPGLLLAQKLHSGIGLILYALSWPILLLAELLRLGDPLWRLTGGLWMLGATLLTLGYLHQLGGWFLVRRMLFPLCFLWLGLPWPTPLENAVIQALTRYIASTTTLIMNMGGVAALQCGNTIVLADQVVGIDTACSGIESFQASIMVSVFLSGLMRLRISAGFALFLGAILSSLIANLGRVVVLTFAAHSMDSQNQTVHGWVGALATVLLFSTVFLLALILQKYCGRKVAGGPALPGASHGPPAGRPGVRAVSGTARSSYGRKSHRDQNRLAWVGAIFSAIAFLSIPLIPGFFLQPNTSGRFADQPRWQIDTANLPSGWSVHALAATDAQKSMLQFSQWTAYQIRTSDGVWSNVVHLFWNTHRGMPSTAFYHTPALCMMSAGWQVIHDPEPYQLLANGQPVPFASYQLRRDLDRVLVLQYLSRGQNQDPFLLEPLSGRGRLERLIDLSRSSREPVNEEILIYLPDLGSDSSNTNLATQILSQFLQPVALR
jgi:exosortase